MASQVLKNVSIWVDGYDASGNMNALALEYAAESLQSTPIEQTTRVKAGGLKNTRMTHSGFWSAGHDAVAFETIGANMPVTIASAGSSTGDLAYLTQTLNAAYKPKLTVGSLAGFTLELEAAGELTRGVVLANEDTTLASGSTGTVQLGLVQQTDELFSTLHVTELTGGGSLVVKVQSDSSPSFTSPVDRITFDTATEEVGQYKSSSLTNTDEYYRAVWTLSAGSAAFAVGVGLRFGVLRSLVTRAGDDIVLRSGDTLIIR